MIANQYERKLKSVYNKWVEYHLYTTSSTFYLNHKHLKNYKLIKIWCVS